METLAGMFDLPITGTSCGSCVACIGRALRDVPGVRRAVVNLATERVTVMTTGDKPRTANAVASRLGIDEVIAGVLPAGKTAAIERLREEGHRVAFAVDRINDAPALATSDVVIAIGTGTDLAIESADVVPMSGDLAGVVDPISLSRYTIANIRQKLFRAFFYNALLVPVAAGALYPSFGLLLSPMLAAGAMTLSSMFALANAPRLRRARAPTSPHLAARS